MGAARNQRLLGVGGSIPRLPHLLFQMALRCVPKRDWSRLPTGITCPSTLPGVTSQMNYLHLNPCFRVYSEEPQTKTEVDPNSFSRLLLEQRWHFRLDRPIFLPSTNVHLSMSYVPGSATHKTLPAAWSWYRRKMFNKTMDTMNEPTTGMMHS